MTLDGVLNKARALEAAATQANKMERETSNFKQKSYHPAKQKERANGLQNARYKVAVNNVNIPVITDSGSTVTLVDRTAYRRLGKPKLAQHPLRYTRTIFG
ncbi:uncharacterized protein LOC123467056 [Daphnia magna]|uniref:uncharacterized protein LOC123467056 n=1 Tax=Daphnia magna TaxID=35525 RepID=UPI001E1BD372|nr:uncharacterized protein LOC123467056 [Daphnia magna]